MNKFRVLLGLLLLCSCAKTQVGKIQEQKEKCLVKNEGAACYYVGALNVQAMSEAMSVEQASKFKRTAGEWLRLGCEYKHAESCFEYANFIAFESPKKADFYMKKACKIEKMIHCR